ncbi:MAG: NAD regulator [Xanthobacteraceae bacterium]|nr:NAD regulator [Xanthobacteraceae bacterium]MCW5673903.1 NAD regulator [Xanthobacteraceae bacterium]
MANEQHPRTAIEIGLAAAIVAIDADTPLILVSGADGNLGLPSGPFDAPEHRTFEIGLRRFVAEQTALEVGYVEQLYTFGDRGRQASPHDTAPHVVSVGYLALTRVATARAMKSHGARFEPWYKFFPWEDWRDGRPKILENILPALNAWAKIAKPAPGAEFAPRERIRLTFGTEGTPWDEERVLERYELLYSAGLIAESRRDGREKTPPGEKTDAIGEPMQFDHRRILATAISRLRAKLKYRPVVFELMPDEFTLTELQRTVEAIAGRHLHKQNFRRLVEGTALVEPTGEVSTHTGGRPAAMYRFRREVLRERPAPGLRFGGR